MATVTATPVPASSAAPVAPAPAPAGVVFSGATWDDYEAMLRIVGERRIRVTFDRGTMEVFMPSFGHDRDAHLLGRIVEVLADVFEVAVTAGRTTTHKRADLEKGAEPDNCYWLGDNARSMFGKVQLDLSVDPPPDLIIEVDVASSSLERFPIFAAMGVAEVWRLAAGALEFLHLQPDGTYQPRETNVNFSPISAADIVRLLEIGRSEELNAWVRSVHAFASDQRAGQA